MTNPIPMEILENQELVQGTRLPKRVAAVLRVLHEAHDDPNVSVEEYQRLCIRNQALIMGQNQTVKARFTWEVFRFSVAAIIGREPVYEEFVLNHQMYRLRKEK